MHLEKDKQGGSREEGKSERSQTAGCGEESGSSKRDGKCLGSVLQRLMCTPKPSCTIVKEVTADFMRNYRNSGKGTSV